MPMPKRSAALAVVLLGGLVSAGCGGASSSVAAQAPGEGDLPGIDTTGFTSRERHELGQYAAELASPCAEVAVPLDKCLTERRSCSACLPAAKLIAHAVRNGLAWEQIRDLYKQRFDSSSLPSIALEGSPSRGPESAPVVLVEFADFECPFCQKLAPELDALYGKHSGELRFVYKFLPLPMHPHGEPAARAAIAAQMQGRFWPMHHLLFANGQHLEQPDLETYAKTIGLDVERFRADMASAAATARLDTDRKLADKLGIKGTPSIYINSRAYDSKVDIEEWVEDDLRVAGKGAR
jgi:predicted DsbA family dithiol-disulfide isomerase